MGTIGRVFLFDSLNCKIYKLKVVGKGIFWKNIQLFSLLFRFRFKHFNILVNLETDCHSVWFIVRKLNTKLCVSKYKLNFIFVPFFYCAPLFCAASWAHFVPAKAFILSSFLHIFLLLTAIIFFLHRCFCKV